MSDEAAPRWEDPQAWAAHAAATGREALAQAALEAQGMPPGHGTFYDRTGRVISLFCWAALSRRRDYLVLAETRAGSRRVVTWWLGRDYAFGLPGSPFIFQTMVLGPRRSGGPMILTTTEAGAMGAHLVRSWIVRGKYAIEDGGAATPWRGGHEGHALGTFPGEP